LARREKETDILFSAPVIIGNAMFMIDHSIDERNMTFPTPFRTNRLRVRQGHETR
jgi:hypothetical protein